MRENIGEMQIEKSEENCNTDVWWEQSLVLALAGKMSE
jgi:hypothetical protein